MLIDWDIYCCWLWVYYEYIMSEFHRFKRWFRKVLRVGDVGRDRLAYLPFPEWELRCQFIFYAILRILHVFVWAKTPQFTVNTAELLATWGSLYWDFSLTENVWNSLKMTLRRSQTPRGYLWRWFIYCASTESAFALLLSSL